MSRMTGEDREQGRAAALRAVADDIARSYWGGNPSAGDQVAFIVGSEVVTVRQALAGRIYQGVADFLAAHEDAVRAEERKIARDWTASVPVALLEAAEAGKREAEERILTNQRSYVEQVKQQDEGFRREIEALEAEVAQLKVELKEERRNWTFVPDENGGHLLSRYKDKWVPYGMVSDARAEIERLRAQLTKEQEHWRLIVSSVESKEAEIERLLGQRQSWQRVTNLRTKELDTTQRRVEVLEKAAEQLCRWIRHTVPTWTPEVDKYLEATEAALQGTEPQPEECLSRNRRRSDHGL
jgi:DNA repair exonuclease SbcCD ATPase subunit